MVALQEQAIEQAAAAKTSNRLTDDAVVLVVKFRKPGVRRQADKSKITCEADKEWMGFSKKILSCQEYRDIQTLIRDFRNYAESRAVDCPLESGSYFVPLAVLNEVCERLEATEEEFKLKVEAFLLAYPAAIESAKDSLKDQFKATDYPDAEDVRRMFSVESRIVDFTPPSESKVGHVLSTRARQKFEENMQNAAVEIQAGLRAGLKKVVHHLSERLDAIVAGGKKQLSPAAVGAVMEFIDSFKDRNLTNDAELDGLVIQARLVLDGKTPDELKQGGTAAEEVLAEFQRVEGALDQLLQDAPHRVFALEE